MDPADSSRKRASDAGRRGAFEADGPRPLDGASPPPAGSSPRRHGEAASEGKVLETLGSVEVREFGPGEVVARQGERAAYVYRLVSGRLRACVVPDEDGVPEDDAILERARTVAVAARPGDVPGEAGSLLERRATSLVAETEVRLEAVRARAARLSRLALERPELGVALAEGQARRLVEAACGLRLHDTWLSEVRAEAHRHGAALGRIIETLASRRGDLRKLAARAREAAGRPGGTQADALVAGRRRSPHSKRGSRARDTRAVRDIAASVPGEVTELAAGQWVYREGEPLQPSALGRSGPRPVFIVLGGELEVVACGRRLDRAGQDEVVGGVAALLPHLGTRPFGLRAVRPSRVACLPGEGLRTLAAERPALAEHLPRVLSRRLERAYHALACLQDDLASAVRDLDGGEGSLASAYSALGANLAQWADDVPDVVREVGTRLAAVRECARRSARETDDALHAFLEGLPFRRLLGRRELAAAESHVRRAFDLLRGSGRDPSGGDASEEMLAAAEAVLGYAALDGDLHWRGRGDIGGLERHSVAVAVWSLLVARRLGCGSGEMREIALAGLLHDVGMLRAETGLEFLMEAHATEYATAYLARIQGLPPGVVPAVCQHHEHVDGSGYPRRIMGERMCLGGMTLSAANQIDLLMAKGLDPGEAVRTLAIEAPRYSPQVLSALFEIVRGAER